MMDGFTLHEAPHMGDVGENDPRRGNSQLLAFARILSQHSDFGSSKKVAAFVEGAIAASVLHRVSSSTICDSSTVPSSHPCVDSGPSAKKENLLLKAGNVYYTRRVG